MKRSTEFIVLFIFWLLLNFSIELKTVISGIFVSILITRLSRDILFDATEEPLKFPSMWRLVWFNYIVFIEIFIAAFQHIIRIIKKDGRPVVFKVELSTNDAFAITMISNAITLTPGTITLSADGAVLTVLGLATTDEKFEQTKYTITNKFQRPFL